MEKDEQFLVVDADEIKKRYAKVPNFFDALWYITRQLKEQYGSQLLRKMKIEVECDWHFLEIQIPIAEPNLAVSLALNEAFINLCEDARKIYGSVADDMYLITRYEDY
ncbi:hypothetical protein [Methanolapillus africanus]|uniref:hypothetical protein n=1 Tax=Methanolapillus africanus TaxID=3028297 RepID=UPI0030B8D59F